MLALLPTTISLLLMLFVRIFDTNERGDKKHLNNFSGVALTIAAYLMILIILENLFTFSLWSRIITFSILLLLLLWPFKVASSAIGQELAHETSKEPLLNHEPTYLADMGITQAVRTANFWLLFFAMVCGLGSGLATINNISQIGESLGYTTVEINTLVSLLSIWNFLGRFGGGFVSDILLFRFGWPRPLLMGIMLLIMTLGHMIIALGFSGNLYIGTIVVGVCYGSLWSLMPTITSEIFGVRNMGTIFNTIAIGSPVGSYVLSVRVIGYIYDEEAVDNSCSGIGCFMVSFLILGGVSFFGFLIDLVLFFRTRDFYKLVLRRRLQRLEDDET